MTILNIDFVTHLKVTQVSQVGAFADKFNNDCGQACVAMNIRTKGISVTVDELYAELGNPYDSYTTYGQLSTALNKRGIKTRFDWYFNYENMMVELLQGNPQILLVGYEELEKANSYSTFKGQHFLVAVGLDGDDILYHDPLYPNQEGAYLRMNKDDFRSKVWLNASPQGTALIVELDAEIIGTIAVPQPFPLQPPMPQPLPEHGFLPTGNGVFLWSVWSLMKNFSSVDHMIDALKTYNVTWVAAKITDGKKPSYNALYEIIYSLGKGYNFGSIIKDLQAAGIRVIPWGYVYGEDPIGEANAVKKYMDKYDFKTSFIINAEYEYKNNPTAAENFASALRVHLPDAMIALSTYRFPELHPEFPFAEFDPFIDAYFPQVYWIKGKDPAGQLRDTLVQHRQITNKPIIPAGSAFSEYGWTATINEMNDFTDEAIRLGLPAIHWWTFSSIEELNLGAGMIYAGEKYAQFEIQYPENPTPPLDPPTTPPEDPLSELEKDRIFEQGREVGIEEGKAIGMSIGVAHVIGEVREKLAQIEAIDKALSDEQ